MSGAARASLVDAVRSSELVEEGDCGVVMVSGGADSAALAAGLAGAVGDGDLVVLHLNYGLRDEAGLDEETCAELCSLLGLELVVERPALSGAGNLQAEARRLRYQLAESLRRTRGLDWVAAGHTRTDLAETVIYRLATSPGRRALLGLRARRGSLLRPMLGLDRAQVRSLAREAGLPFRDDPTNAEPLFARNRIRNEVLPVLEQIGPALEATIAETQAELAEEADTLDRLASEALTAAGADVAGAIGADALAELDPALRRLALRSLAERAAGRPVPLGRERAAEIARLAADPEGGVVELGGGVEARAEGGYVRFSAGERSPAATPEASLSVPGSCRFGEWEVRAKVHEGPIEASGPDAAFLDPAALSGVLGVRSWRDGDRIRPLGLDGTKSLQDLFTDRKVPRSLRHTLPVVTSGGRIAWIAGVAVSDEFAAEPGSERAVVLDAAISPDGAISP